MYNYGGKAMNYNNWKQNFNNYLIMKGLDEEKAKRYVGFTENVLQKTKITDFEVFIKGIHKMLTAKESLGQDKDPSLIPIRMLRNCYIYIIASSNKCFSKMKLRDFYGKTLFAPNTKTRYKLESADGAQIKCSIFENGTWRDGVTMTWMVGTGPYSNVVADGYLVFEEPELTRQFIEVFEEYSNSEDGRFDMFSYYFQHYD
jgi:hypothetical protein